MCLEKKNQARGYTPAMERGRKNLLEILQMQSTVLAGRTPKDRYYATSISLARERSKWSLAFGIG